MRSSYINKQDRKGIEILIHGTVQGVGFRPFVYNLASRLGISGTVINTGDGVRIRATAQGERLFAFIDGLKNEAPPLARITSLEQFPLVEDVDYDGFSILKSVAGNSAKAVIPPDIALCDDCLRELRDPSDHRYNYPFINCTNCGPRFTIVETIPYDRPKTSMKVFPMCPVCQEQYEDPADRRFHAQPNACGHCGPQLSWHDNSGKEIEDETPLFAAAKALSDGNILAMRGLGGFHLTVNAHSDEAVSLLRARKGRPDKPLAVMMPDLETVNNYCFLSDKEIELLTSTVHPIVLLKKRSEFSLSNNLAPGINELGVMLPYTPFHHLLFAEKACPDALVMTSGNISGTPICTANDDAVDRLANIADYFLLHNRDIVTRVDDSVTRVVGEKVQILRRARGYVPSPIEINWSLPQTIGCGGGLKSTFSLARDRSVFTSQHIGDLTNLESYDFYTESVDHLQSVLQIEPEIVVCDLHPDYMSTHFAAELNLPIYKVQHHHAHAVAVMAEHGLEKPVLAVVLDGTGFGPDGTIWGGEILECSLTDYKRLGHLQQLHLPGGDSAATEPYRMGLSALYRLNNQKPWPEQDLPLHMKQYGEGKTTVINSMLENNFNSPLTSSCGRLFDAISAILGIRQKISYEGQAAIELEARARSVASPAWYEEIPKFRSLHRNNLLCKEGEKWEICSTEFVRLTLAALDHGNSVEKAALQFHYLLISSIAELLNRLPITTGITEVVLTGGCMQNSLLLEGLHHTLTADRFEVYTGEAIPINDGGISLGQTIIGGLRHVSCNTDEGNQG